MTEITRFYITLCAGDIDEKSFKSGVNYSSFSGIFDRSVFCRYKGICFNCREKNDKLVEEYENKTIEISEIEKLNNYFTFDDELKTSIKSCKAYFTPTAIVFTTIQCYYGSGKLTVTEDYYNKLLNEYDDLKLMSGFPSRNYLGYFEEDITNRADNDFLTFIRNEEYYYSEKLSDSEGMLILLSQEKGEIYFFINSF